MSCLRYQDPRCVFVRVPKTGSTSIIRGLLGGKENAVEICRTGFPERWEHLFSFAIVRNPYDRFVSAYRMFEHKNYRKEPVSGCSTFGFELVVRALEDESLSHLGTSLGQRLKRHFLPMSHEFFGLDRVDYLGRFEHFDETWSTLTRKLGLPEAKVTHERKADRQSYRSFFTAATRSEFERLFREDLERFEYGF